MLDENFLFVGASLMASELNMDSSKNIYIMSYFLRFGFLVSSSNQFKLICLDGRQFQLLIYKSSIATKKRYRISITTLASVVPYYDFIFNLTRK